MWKPLNVCNNRPRKTDASHPNQFAQNHKWFTKGAQKDTSIVTLIHIKNIFKSGPGFNPRLSILTWKYRSKVCSQKV